jgi:hypothetical protein
MGEGAHKKKRVSTKQIAFVVFILVLFIGGGVSIAVWQRGNFDAARLYLNNTPQDINTQLAQNEQQIVSSVQKLVPQPITDLTDEEKQQLASNELTKDQAVALILGRAKSDETSQAAASPTDSANSASNQVSPSPATGQPNATEGPAASDNTAPAQDAASPDETKTTEAATPTGAANGAVGSESTATQDANTGAASGDMDASQADIAEAAAEVYVLRADFSNRLDSLLAAAIAEYKALSPSDRTTAKKTELAMKYLKLGGELESECDAQMDSITTKLETELRQTGGDTSIVTDLQSAYAQEKSLKKAYYLSLYKNN